MYLFHSFECNLKSGCHMSIHETITLMGATNIFHQPARQKNESTFQVEITNKDASADNGVSLYYVLFLIIFCLYINLCLLIKSFQLLYKNKSTISMKWVRVHLSNSIVTVTPTIIYGTSCANTLTLDLRSTLPQLLKAAKNWFGLSWYRIKEN